jgi:hypothetical protein
MVCRLRIYHALMEQISGYEHEINPAAYGILLDHLSPGSEEIARAIWEIVSPYAQMYIRYVEEPRHVLASIPSGPAKSNWEGSSRAAKLCRPSAGFSQ